MISKVSVIIVNWNAGSQLGDVISSIATHHDGYVDTVVIVDNASTDDSLAIVETLAHDLPFPLEVIRNKENRGFGAACNQGALLATSEFLLFLNPDTRLLDGSLSKPVTYMLRPENSNVGIVGIQLLDEFGRVAHSCSRFPSVGIFLTNSTGLNRLYWMRRWTQAMVEWAHDMTRQVDQVMGAFFFIRRSLFTSLGGFDERFFVYFEEVDLSFRAYQAGYRSMFLSDSQTFHAGGGTSRQVKAHRLFYSLRSRLLYGFKHFSLWRAWVLVFITICIEPLTRTVFAFRSSGWNGVSNTMKAYRMLFLNFGYILKQKKGR